MNLHASEIGQGIGSLVFPTPNRTGAQAGKEKAWQQKFYRSSELYDQYNTEVEDIAVMVPIDKTRIADEAYMRIMWSRSIRKAIREGKPVPAAHIEMMNLFRRPTYHE